MSNIRLAGLSIAVGLLVGCGMYANIPPQVGDTATNEPNRATIKEVIAVGTRAVVDDQPLSVSYTVILPPGMLPASYDEIVPKIGQGATWSSDGSTPAQPIVRVKQVRVRGWSAEVDVIRPSNGGMGDGPPNLVTAYLSWHAFGGWSVDKLRIWRTGVGVEVTSDR